MHIQWGMGKLVLLKKNNTWNLKESQYVWSSQRTVSKLVSYYLWVIKSQQKLLSLFMFKDVVRLKFLTQLYEI